MAIKRDKILDFKSKESYKKFLAYGYSHDKSGKLIPKGSRKKNVFASTLGHQGVRIRGKLLRDWAYAD